MKPISLELCIDYQMCFFHKDKFSPFELVENYKTYFPLALIGEIGSILNVYCKTFRSAKIYSPEISDECADTFIYLLIYGLYIENETNVKVFERISDAWSTQPLTINNDYALCSLCAETIRDITTLPQLVDEKSDLPLTFERIFNNIKAVNYYVLHQDWQVTIDLFHEKSIQKFSEINSFALDYKYKGSCWLNIKKFLEFINKTGVQLPLKRISYLGHIAKHQEKLLEE